MVKVRFWQEGGRFCFSCKGHAGFAKQGQPDIVCAAVSALSMTLCNALTHAGDFRCKVQSGEVSVSCAPSVHAAHVFETIIIGFYGLTARYPEHVTITQDGQGGTKWYIP